MLQLEHVSFRYPDQPLALKDITFRVRKGSVVGILGHNGSGKTTLLRLISRIVQAQGGKINWAGKEIQQYSRGQYYSTLGALVEAPVLYDHLSLQDNLGIFHRYRPESSREDLYEMIEQLGLAPSLSARTGKFSTGMRQRVGLALAMYHKPELLLLDEPTTGLDPDGIILARELLSQARSKGAAIIVTGHNLAEIEKTADEFIILKQGQLVYQGPAEATSKYRDLEELYLAITRATP